MHSRTWNFQKKFRQNIFYACVRFKKETREIAKKAIGMCGIKSGVLLIGFTDPSEVNQPSDQPIRLSGVLLVNSLVLW